MFVTTTSVLWRNLLDASRSVSKVFFKKQADITLLHSLRTRIDKKQTFVLVLVRCSVLTVVVAALIIRYIVLRWMLDYVTSKYTRAAVGKVRTSSLSWMLTWDMVI